MTTGYERQHIYISKHSEFELNLKQQHSEQDDRDKIKLALRLFVKHSAGPVYFGVFGLSGTVSPPHAHFWGSDIKLADNSNKTNKKYILVPQLKKQDFFSGL